MKTDKKIEDRIGAILTDWHILHEMDSGLVEDLTNLFNTEVQKAVEEAFIAGTHAGYPDMYDCTNGEALCEQELETYLQTLKDKEVE